MSLVFRILLIVASILFLFVMMRKIHHSKLQIDHSLFWIIFSIIIVLLAVFPQVPVYLAELLGIQSPVNLVYLVVIFVLIVKLFQDTMHISKLENKIKSLTQHQAIEDHDNNKKEVEE